MFRNGNCIITCRGAKRNIPRPYSLGGVTHRHFVTLAALCRH